MALLFVYGTLQQGYHNKYARYLHTHSTLLGAASFPGQLYRVSWYPAALYNDKASGHVHGEVYQLHQPDETLTLLDAYEDIAENDTGMYVRRQIPIMLSDQPVSAWIYLYNQPTAGLELIDSGRWT